MMPLNYTLQNCKGSYKFTKSPEKINQLMYMDSKIFVKNEKKKKNKQKTNKKLLYKQ